jgi:threonine dehydrogenase-like Zn-dependent dehydrogenase
MKALVYCGDETMEYRDMPDPEPAAGEVLVRIAASCICGSDMHAFLGHDERRPAPLILGHEASGTIVGGDEDGLPVTINPLVTCGNCRDCLSGRTNLCAHRQIISMQPRQGAFAEFVSMPRQNLVTVPESVPLSRAALTEAISCGWHGVRMGSLSLDMDMAQSRCLVIGGGAIGVGSALSLKAMGATDISVMEPNGIRREQLQTIDGFGVIDPTGSDLPEKATFDLVIDGVGYAATRASACVYVRQGGTIVHIGLGEATGGLDIRRMTLQEIRFIGTYTYTATDFRDTAAAIFDGSLGALDWTETRPMAEGLEAFRDIRAGRVGSPKIVLTP